MLQGGTAAPWEVDAERLDLVVHYARAARQELGVVRLNPVRDLECLHYGIALFFVERDTGRRNLHDRGAFARLAAHAVVSEPEIVHGDVNSLVEQLASLDGFLELTNV